MPRKGWVVRRRIPGDPVYGSDLVQKFISSMMYDGKRSTAQTIFYDAMDQVAKKSNDDAFKLFKKAVENCKPTLEVKTRRVGGANYQVPVEVNPFRRQSLAIHWLVLYSRTRSGKSPLSLPTAIQSAALAQPAQPAAVAAPETTGSVPTSRPAAVAAAVQPHDDD